MKYFNEIYTECARGRRLRTILWLCFSGLTKYLINATSQQPAKIVAYSSTSPLNISTGISATRARKREETHAFNLLDLSD